MDKDFVFKILALLAVLTAGGWLIGILGGPVWMSCVYGFIMGWNWDSIWSWFRSLNKGKENDKSSES